MASEKRKLEKNHSVEKKAKKEIKKWKVKSNCSFDTPKEKVSEFLEENGITFVPSSRVKEATPFISFDQVKLPKKLRKTVAQFKQPTAIQAISWPSVFQGNDFVGIAATGSGKTLAFGVPALIHVHNQFAEDKNRGATKVLILSPTRELAIQIHEQLEKFGSPMGINSIVLYGGVPKYEQKKLLSEGPDVIVATPGRLLDLANEGAVDLSHVGFFVLDEADRMLDLGFEQDIIKIVSQLPDKDERQTVMFSATWPTAIQKLSMKYLNDPVRVTVGSTDLSANKNITQHVEVIDPNGKDRRLIELLKQYHKTRKNRVLVFCLYKKEAARVEQYLQRNGYNVVGIHGDLNQQQRTQALQGFRDGSKPLLIATDVAARGLDIPNVEYVINYTYPLTTEEYCHRIGRTGRAGNKGVSHTLFTVHDKSHSGALINVLKQANQSVPEDLMKFGTTVKKKLDPNYGAFVKDIDPNQKATKIVFGDSDDE